MLQVDEFSNVIKMAENTFASKPYIHLPRGVITCNWRGQDPAACEVCEPFLIEDCRPGFILFSHISEGEDWS